MQRPPAILPDDPERDASDFLGDAVSDLGRDLAESLRSLLLETGAANLKPVEVASRLEIAKTVAWRLCKVADAVDPLLSLLSSPAPNGLLIIRDAALRHGLSDASAERLRDVVERFKVLIDSVPEGRNGLNSALSSVVTRASSTADRDARRKIFQGTAHVQGIAIEASYGCTIVTPSPTDPYSCDSATVSGWVRLRRPRPGAPTLLTAFGAANADEDEGLATQWVSTFRTLDGEHASDVGSFLLDEYCSDSRPDLVVDRRDAMVQVQLPGNRPRLTDTLDLFFANRNSAVYHRYYDDETKPYVMDRFASRSARRVWMTDLLLHKDAFPGAGDPFMTYHLGGIGPLAGIGYTPETSFDALDIDGELQKVGTGIDGLHTPEIPNLRDVLRTTFERLGEDPADYTAWRCVQEFPLPGIVAVRWIPVSARPSD